MRYFNILEAAIGIAGSIYFFLYYTGKLNYNGQKEERRIHNVKKNGTIIVLSGIICMLGSLFLFYLTLFKMIEKYLT